MLDYLRVGDLPSYYQGLIVSRNESYGLTTVGRVVELDLEAMLALQQIGFQATYWNNTSYIKAAERWGSKNVMRVVGYTPSTRPWRKIPKYALIEGRDSHRYGNGTLYSKVRVMRWVIIDRIDVYLNDRDQDKAHLIHPNCTLRFI